MLSPNFTPISYQKVSYGTIGEVYRTLSGSSDAMNFPNWQQRIRANTARIAAGDTTERWGRAYANFLRNQADEIDEALGQSEYAAKREERFREKTRLYNAIRQLLEANPNLSAYKAALLTGGSDMTVWRYMRHIRERFDIVRDPKALSPFVQRRKRPNGQFKAQPAVPDDIDDGVEDVDYQPQKVGKVEFAFCSSCKTRSDPKHVGEPCSTCGSSLVSIEVDQRTAQMWALG